jgi:hypothetical protein
MGNTASFLIKNTLPLGFNVNNDVKSKIWSDQFVEFYKLLPNLGEEEDDDVLFKTSIVKITKNAKPKQLMSIHQWTVPLIFVCLFIMKSSKFYYVIGKIWIQY